MTTDNDIICELYIVEFFTSYNYILKTREMTHNVLTEHTQS